MPECPDNLIIRLVKENVGRFRTRYTEYFPGSILGGIYINNDNLRQTFGEIPKRIQIEIMEVTK